MTDSYHIVKHCRICGDNDFSTILDLGKTPLANSFLSTHNEKELFVSLTLRICNSCALVQLKEVVNPEIMFKEYPYRTSSSQTLPQHFKNMAREIVSMCHYSGISSPRVYDIGSNDGTLLKALVDEGAHSIGIEPAANLRRIAKARGMVSVPGYFNRTIANELVNNFGFGKAVIANNVLGHVDDLNDFVSGVYDLLEPGGIFICEVHYLGDLIQNVEYDTIYHEHLSYFSISPLLKLLHNNGFCIIDVKRFDIHGGILRVTAGKSNAPDVKLPIITNEENWGLYDVEYLEVFNQRVQYQITLLQDLLYDIKNKDKRIVGYGAPAKGNTLLNVCKIGSSVLDYITDTTLEKQGKFTPGTHIPVNSPSIYKTDKPDYALLLAWNFLPEIIKNETNFRGKFIVPIPSPKILL